MIPTMILFGLVLGRWWKSAIAAGVVVWPTILFLAGIIGGADVLGADDYARSDASSISIPTTRATRSKSAS